MAGQMDNINTKPESDNKTTSEPKPQLSDVKEMTSEDAMPTTSPSNMNTNTMSQPPSERSATTSTGSASTTVTSMGTATTATASWPITVSQVLYTNDSETASVTGEPRLRRHNVPKLPTQGIGETTFVHPCCIPARYLESAPYVDDGSVPEVIPVLMPLYQMPVLVIPDPNLLQVQDLYPYAGGLALAPILPPRVPYAGMSTLQVPSHSYRTQQRLASRRTLNPRRHRNVNKRNNMLPQQ